MLLLAAEALTRVSLAPTIEVVYCDTGTEIPTVRDHAIKVLTELEGEADARKLPMRVSVLRPPVQDRFLVKVLGRGYPPPSGMFRWCTDRLRVWPIQRVLQELRPCDVYVGTRWGESSRRNHTMSKYATDDEVVFKHSRMSDVCVVSPIVDFTTEDVWSAISQHRGLECIDPGALATLYAFANGECAALETRISRPCAAGRFGCWTCTLVDQDRASENLAANGHRYLVHLLAWRDMLIRTSRDAKYRCPFRRNGRPGKGPLTMEARRILLDALLTAQAEAETVLLTDEEHEYILHLWNQDESSDWYLSNVEACGQPNYTPIT